MDFKAALREVYGCDEALLRGQLARYEGALAEFGRRFGTGRVSIFRAPGRVNLIGEHTDYNQGYVLPVALDRDIILLARPRRDDVVVVENVEGDFAPRSFRLGGDIPPGEIGDWGNYVKGAAQALWRAYGPGLRGMEALVVGEAPFGVPRGAGLSSSSALTVVAAVALAELNGLDIPPASLAKLCSEAEWYVGTRGGIMDHFIALLARRGHALFLDCRPRDGAFPTEHVPLPKGYKIVIADSGVRRENTRSEFNLRVAEDKIGVELLRSRFPGITHLRDVSPSALGLTMEELEAILEEVLPERATEEELMALGVERRWLEELRRDHRLPQGIEYRVRRRCRHVITENERVLASLRALRRGDAAAFGRLMNEAHASLRDDYGVSCPELEALVDAANEVEGCYGSRLTGAGFGGCIVSLVAADAVVELERHVTQRYRAQTGREATVIACATEDGVGLI